jgi:hypothetical protein
MSYSPDNDKLSNLYSIITEAKELDLSMFETPPPRAKFKEGQFVTVRDFGKFKSYHTKRHLPYANKTGVIVGYYNYPGAYTKYTIKFEDGTVLPIHSQFILGPFRTKEIAKTHEDPTKEIVASDIQFPENRPAFQEWQVNDKIESIAREHLTQGPYNFRWHETPIAIEDPENTATVTFILAEHRKGYNLTRENNKLTKRLTGGAYGGYKLELPPNLKDVLFKKAYNNPFCTPIYDMLKDTYKNSDIKKIQTPEYKDSYAVSFEVTKHRALNNESFILLLSPYLQQTEDGYLLIIPEGEEFVYMPKCLKDCSILDNLTIKGNAYIVKRGYANDESIFFRSPKQIQGNLRVSFSPTTFDNIPRVSGELTFNEPQDKNRYLKYIAGSHHSDFKDLLDY